MYTEEIHAECLLKMLNRPDPCRYCPVFFADDQYKNNLYACCYICFSFIGRSFEEALSVDKLHPCTFFGTQEAIKRTWLALEEKGYLELCEFYPLSSEISSRNPCSKEYSLTCQLANEKRNKEK